MTNLELVVSVLAAHREDRRWADEAVAADILTRLGLAGDAKHGAVDAAPVQGQRRGK